MRPLGWSLPAPWDPIAGDYASQRWLDPPAHQCAAPSRRRRTGARCTRRSASDRGGGRALVERRSRSRDRRRRRLRRGNAYGGAVAARTRKASRSRTRTAHRSSPRPTPGRATQWTVNAARPLAGIRVLDLTRVLAGPVASRFLAGYGANVLRIDPPTWNEPGVVPEVTLGKRCARLDLRLANDRTRFRRRCSSAPTCCCTATAPTRSSGSVTSADARATDSGPDRRLSERLRLDRTVARIVAASTAWCR